MPRAGVLQNLWFLVASASAAFTTTGLATITAQVWVARLTAPETFIPTDISISVSYDDPVPVGPVYVEARDRFNTFAVAAGDLVALQIRSSEDIVLGLTTFSAGLGILPA